MRALTLMIGIVLLTLINTEVSASTPNRVPAAEKVYSCRISNGYVEATGYSYKSKNDAKAKAWLKCGEMMIDDYIARRGSIPEDRVEELSTACVNYDCI